MGKHIAGGASFISNLVLWSESGYFDNAAETKPLLHLWSLGVEEQFYILFPTLIWFAWKRNFNLLTVTLLIAGISFWLNIKEIKTDMVSAFYSPQTRFWELMCGSLLAWITLYRDENFSKFKSLLDKWLTIAIYRKPRSFDGKTFNNAISFLGLLLLIYGFFRISKELSFPGKWALVPVFGAIFIISAGQQAWINRTILSNRVAVWFGLISFPLYLWHWILLSFSRVVESETPSREIRIVCVLLSIFFAWITYRYIERPFRYGQKNLAKISTLVTLMMVVFLVGAITNRQSGFPFRPSLQWSEINGTGEDALDDHQKCMKMYGLEDYIRYCKVSGNYKPNIALIGDSHGSALFKGLSEELEKEGRGLLNIGGRLFLDVETYPLGSNSEIEIYKGGIRATEFVSKEKSISTVIMASRGPFYISGDWIFKLISSPNITDREKVWEIGMRKTLDSMVLSNKDVIFVIDNPEISFDPRKCITRPFRLTQQDSNHCTIPRAQYDIRNQVYRGLVFKILKDYPTVKVFDAAAYFCDKEKCWAKSNDRVLYADSDHLSVAGARYISQDLVKVINGAKSKTLN